MELFSNATISTNAMARIAQAMATKIKLNTLAGLDKDGKPFVEYSKKPFAMPAGAFKPRSKLAKEIKDGNVSYFKRNGAKWLVIEGGYTHYRQVRGKGTQVNLSDTGSMLRSLMPLKVDGNSILIGFKREEEAIKAYYHNVAGAGKGKTKREFLGLPEDDVNQIINEQLNDSNDLILKQ